MLALCDPGLHLSFRSFPLKRNCFLRKFCFRGVVLILFAIGSLVSPVFGQAVKTESVVGAGPYLSLEGRFSIALPLVPSGFKPLSVDSAVGKMHGDAYTWKMKEGSFTVGYVDATQPIDDAVTTAKIFASIRDGLASLASSRNGKVAAEKQIEIDKHQVLEVKLEIPQAVFWQRCYVASSRLYQIVLIIRPEQLAGEAVALKVLDTFKILTEAEVSEAKKAKAAAAEPSPKP